VLVAALESFKLPVAGAFLILGVDALLDMARTSVNVLGTAWPAWWWLAGRGNLTTPGLKPMGRKKIKLDDLTGSPGLS